jgi:hypothetical protein
LQSSSLAARPTSPKAVRSRLRACTSSNNRVFSMGYNGLVGERLQEVDLDLRELAGLSPSSAQHNALTEHWHRDRTAIAAGRCHVARPLRSGVCFHVAYCAERCCSWRKPELETEPRQMLRCAARLRSAARPGPRTELLSRSASACRPRFFRNCSTPVPTQGRLTSSGYVGPSP